MSFTTNISAGLRAPFRRTHEGNAFILYGSHSRGDSDCLSDVDILEVTSLPGRRVSSRGRTSVHRYTPSDLRTMAKQGSLFVLHLLREGTFLHDGLGIERLLEDSFHAPSSFAVAERRRLATASRLLNVERSLFEESPRGFFGAAFFLARTLLYARYADSKTLCFSLRWLAAVDSRAAFLRTLKHSEPSYSQFLAIRDLVLEEVFVPEAAALHSFAAALAATGGDPLAQALTRRIMRRAKTHVYALSPTHYRADGLARRIRGRV